MTTIAPLTDEEARVLAITAQSLDRVQDIEHALTIGMLTLRNFTDPAPGTLEQIVETQDAILTALHGPDWHLQPEAVAALASWHYPDPCFCGPFRSSADVAVAS